MKKAIKKILASALALTLTLAMGSGAHAATVPNATIDRSKTGSLTIVKYDKSAQTGVENFESYVSTGYKDEALENAFSEYGIPGVTYTYLKVGNIETYSQTSGGNSTTKVVYGMRDDVQSILGLAASAAQKTVSGINYFTSDQVNAALAGKMNSANVATKNSLEALAKANGTAMTATNAAGRTTASGLALGLYLVVETNVPADVTVTTNPFFISLPMSNHLSGNVTDAWNYNVTVYPKNQTEIPEMQKDVAEVKAGVVQDYANFATASAGDTVSYHVITDLTSINDATTYFTKLTWEDELSEGLSYVGGDVKLEWFASKNDQTAKASWDEASGKFTVAIQDNKMTVDLTAAGLTAVNPAYSGYRVVMTYTAKVNSNDTATFGDDGNPNEVLFTYSRDANKQLVGTLEDDAVVYTYAIDVTKTFSDSQGDATKVKFTLQNATDGYFVVASGSDGTYYVTGTAAAESGATVFSPAASGSLKIYGLENDTYTLTENQTDSGYTLLKDAVSIVITATEEIDSESEESLGTLTASAKVNGNAVTMLSDGDSENAIAPLTIVNQKGFDIPATGESGAFILPLIGMLGAAVIIMIAAKKKEATEEA